MPSSGHHKHHHHSTAPGERLPQHDEVLSPEPIPSTIGTGVTPTSTPTRRSANPSNSSRTSAHAHLEPLTEATMRKITEYDLLAYSKEEMTLSMQKNIMNRMFQAFDFTQRGYLEREEADDMYRHLGQYVATPGSIATEMGAGPDGRVTFEQFWKWWVENGEKEVSIEQFAMSSAAFTVPYHQQQLCYGIEGEIYTPRYRIFFYLKDMETQELRRVSPWHDIPLYVRDFVRTTPETVPVNRYNFVCEIPKWTRAKFEISTGEDYNPIRQDMKNGMPRFYKHGDMMWNYGAFPQTWESTEVTFFEGVTGDNDPLDGIEIGMTQVKAGTVIPVKVLGVLGMIDDGQMDWKVICISHTDPIARFLNDIHDIPKYLPGCLDAIREWLRVYKICQGGVENKFAFDGKYRKVAFAMNVLEESHRMWGNLRKIKHKANV